MENWLANHARVNLWQDPEADGQLITRPVRLTPPSAAIHSARIGRTYRHLPFEGWGHVYQIGTTHPYWGNLNIVRNRWIRGTTLMSTYRTNILVYGISGKTFPLHLCYFTKNDDGMIVIALPCQEIYNWIEHEDVYLRLYKGNEVDQPTESLPPVLAEHHLVENDQHRAVIETRYNELKSQGHVMVYVKGVPVFNFDRDKMGKWDDVEFHLDGRVRKHVSFRVGDLTTFMSELDKCRKYLLHLGGNSRYDFADDVEIHVAFGDVGRYYHLNQSKSLRQLTHADLSIPTMRIQDYLASIPGANDSDELRVHLIVRNDGMAKPLTFNSDRIHELYKLPDEKIIQAITGANSNVPEWRAANLEMSAVNRLIYSKFDSVTRDLATEAYGYNAASYYSANTPSKTTVTAQGTVVQLPALLSKDSTVYEYGADGTLLGHYLHNGPVEYVARNPECAMVEAIVGKAGDRLSVNYNAGDVKLDPKHSYAFYLRVVLSGDPSDEFIPAVEGQDYTVDDDGQLRWTIDNDRRHGVIIDNSRHYFNSITVHQNDGVFRIGVTDLIGDKRLPSFIPMESMELWLNDHPLVYGVDYFVEWPTAVVCAKRYVVDGGLNKLTVRARGVTGEFRKPDHGFVTSGLLSNNDMFDVKDDKVVRIVSGGRLIHRDDVRFRDDTAIGIAYVEDGQPYSIDDPTIPLRNVISTPVLEERDKSRELDERIESYLSVHIPTPPPIENIDLESYYHVFSPVLNSIIFDLIEGRLTLTPDDETYRISDVQLDKIMLNYNDLLDFDPAFLGYDNRFVVVHPHSSYEILALTELQFALVERINHRYLNSSVQLKIGRAHV